MRKLGKGLSELGLNELLGGGTSNSEAVPPSLAFDKIHYIPLDNLVPGQYQPRQHIDQNGLAELADSIRVQGILQPLIVRMLSSSRYEIIAGERRWRGAKLAGLEKAPVIIREISDQTAVAFGLIENIQRRDLNALEEARALQRLLGEFKLTHEEVAEAVGKSRPAITNLLRLLQLNPEVQDWLMQGRLDKGHALVLLSLSGDNQTQCAKAVLERNLSVRQTELLIKKFDSQPQSNHQYLYVEALQKNLSEKLGAKTAIRQNSKGKGKIVIQYRNAEELDRILNLIR